jgi:MFS family permease
VLQLENGSAVALVTVSLVQALAFLVFFQIGGSAADRFDRRKLLFVTQSLLMALALVLAFLTISGVIGFRIILVAAFISGAILSFDQPARNALVASLVPKEKLMNAVSLQSAVFNGAATVGPALAGLALSRFGYAGNFLLNAVSYLAVIAALVAIRPPAVAKTPAASLWASAREALGHVRRDVVLPSALIAYGMLMFFGPSMQLILPVYVVQTIGFGPERLGLLYSAAGAGTVAGAFIVASLGDVRRKGWLLCGSVILWSAALALFITQGNLVLAVIALAVMGASQTAGGATVVTLLQTRVPPQMRGRAMSLNTLLIMCVRPLGDFPLGNAIAEFGLRPTALASAALVGVEALIVLVNGKGVREG